MGPVFKQVALVTAASPYNFTTEDKREMSGVTVEYLLTDNLAPVADGEAKGIKFSKDSLPYVERHNIYSVPGMYEISFAMQPSRGGKPQLKITSVKFVSEVSLTEVLKEKKASA